MSTRVSTILARKGSEVVTIGPDETLAGAADKLRDHDIGALVVSSDGDRVEGIISERDIVRRLSRAGGDCLTQTVAEVMSTEVTTCAPDATADEVMAVMTSGRHRHIPVVEDDRLAGIISIGDAVKSRLDELETRAESLEEYVTGTSY